MTIPHFPSFSLPAAQIAIVGLGPGDVGDIPLAVWQLLRSGRRVILRTRCHPCVDALGEVADLQSCDDLYEQHATFADVYAAIVERVLAAAAEGPVVYALPGHPWVGEMTTAALLARAQEKGLTVHVTGGASFIDAAAAALRLDPMEGCQIVDGMLLAARHHPPLDVSLPALVGQVYSRQVASDVKLTLLNAYPSQQPVKLIHAAGTPNQRIRTLSLHELDWRDDFDHLTSLFVPAQRPGGSFNDLQQLIAHLRAPEGCPWDQEQTLENLREFLLAECCEVLEAMDNEDDEHTAEELGDLLGIVAMIGQVAAEEGRFLLADAIRTSVEKLTRRHPHVFGEQTVEDMAALYRQWDAIKAQERADKGQKPKGPLDGIPASLPALEKARELQSKAEKAGLLQRTLLAEENPALAALLPSGSDAADLGRLLWQLTALAKSRGLQAEAALREYAVRFRERGDDGVMG
ncbi:MAG: MazG family protein [Chloroflexi bacterium]|nr:MazG family protein [Chloroflexota bacterium]